MNTQILPRPAMILQHPNSPPPTLVATAESIASAKAYQASERSRLAALDIIVTDPDGSRALAALLRGEA